MDRVFILGTTKYSFMIHRFIEQEKKYSVLGHTVNKSYMNSAQNECINRNVQLFALEDLSSIVESDEDVKIINTLGYTDMNRIRQKVFDACKEMGYKMLNYISEKAIVMSEIAGEGNIVFPGAYIGTDVVLGNDNVIYSGVVLTHDISIENHNFFAANVSVGGEVHIGNNCFIGMGATIRNRLEVNDYSLIGAATYLSHSTKYAEVLVPNKAITLEKSSFEISLTPNSKKG